MLELEGFLYDDVAQALNATVEDVTVCEDERCSHNSHNAFYQSYVLPDPDETRQDDYNRTFYLWLNQQIIISVDCSDNPAVDNPLREHAPLQGRLNPYLVSVWNAARSQ